MKNEKKVKISKGTVEIEYLPAEDIDNLLITLNGNNTIVEDIFDDFGIIEAELCGELLICDEDDIAKIMAAITEIYEEMEE